MRAVIFVAAALLCAGCVSERVDVNRQWIYSNDVACYLGDVGGQVLPSAAPAPAPRDVRYRPIATYTPAPHYRGYDVSMDPTYRSQPVSTRTQPISIRTQAVSMRTQPISMRTQAAPVRAQYVPARATYVPVHPTTTYVATGPRYVTPSRAVYNAPSAGVRHETATVYVHGAAAGATATREVVGSTSYGYVAPRASAPPVPPPPVARYSSDARYVSDPVHVRRGGDGLAARRTTYDASRNSR